ncbi:hypothetical protein SAMN04488006_0454 [Lutibacter maritimus]|uniref:Uncharacterized protein n=1 Tax=Lutibacter maritimus TaxID=593133 RepID=A0A1I6NRT4_9FLAO|nr:hypothetical protein SAMN04488006_0454 [Lutibacter maritimus]
MKDFREFINEQSKQLCDCEYPNIRTGFDDVEYCGLCMKNIG